MYDALKPLIVVLALSLMVFKLAKPVCLRFMDAKDFARRRNVWLALTFLEFLIPNFWVFSICALALVYWAGSVDRHPTALYAILMVCVPPCEMLIPMPLVNQLFGLTPNRILALALVIPACVRLVSAGESWKKGGSGIDWVMLGYGVLQLALYMEFESFTNTLRRAVLFGIDVYGLYFLFSRGGSTRAALRDTLACFWLTAALQVPIVVFESIKGWLLYPGVVDRWGMPNVFSWLLRGDALRAQGAGGHSLTMGFVLAAGFGVWLYLGRQVQPKRLLLLAGVAMWAGLFATYSRAPWIVAALIFVVFTLFAPGGKSTILKTLIGGACLLAILSVTPFGEKLLSVLPFVGTQDQSNVEYRQQLATVSWQLIQQHPWFGNPFALGEMEDLRQGQGIIDLVNTFAAIALFYGGVGVTLFASCFIYPLIRTFVAVTQWSKHDDDLGGMGATLIAVMLGALLMMATASFGNAFEITAWIFAGLCSAYPVIKSTESAVGLRRPLNPVRRSAAFS